MVDRIRCGAAWVLAGVAVALLGGCKSAGKNPCLRLEESGWTCNLKVVEPLKPGDFIYVKGGQLQRLPGNAEGFRTESRASNIQSEAGGGDWSFGIDVEVPIAGVTTSPNGQLKAAGAEKYTLVFADTRNNSLAANADASPIEGFAGARTRAQQFIEALAVADRNEIGRRARQDNVAEVWLITQTLTSKVNYQFSGNAGFEASGGAAVSQVAGTISGAVANANTKTIEFNKPLSIGYRALKMAVQAPPQQGPARLTINDAAYSSPK